MSKELAESLEHWKKHKTLIRPAVSIPLNLLDEAIAALRAEPVVWMDGFPSKPWSDEWFIAETTYGDRVVLTALPEEYAYDFKTADDTYIKADKIKRWMQFPDSEYVAPSREDQRSEAASIQPTTGTSASGAQSSDHPTEQSADELLREAVDDLRAVLCDPEGNASIHGSVGDLAIVEGALQRIDAHLARKEQ